VDGDSARSLARPGPLWHLSLVTRRRFFLLRLADNVRAEATEFKTAFAEAPEPDLKWDVLGVRSLMHKTWWRLMREHVEPNRLFWAVFLGVLIGLSPFYGGHVIAALVCAMVFRLNKLAIWLATNVSFPIISPFFAFISCQLGHLILEGSFLPIGLTALRAKTFQEAVRELFVYWMVGFPLHGLILGSILGGVTWRVARRRQREVAEEAAAAGPPPVPVQ